MRVLNKNAHGMNVCYNYVNQWISFDSKVMLYQSNHLIVLTFFGNLIVLSCHFTHIKQFVIHLLLITEYEIYILL